MTKTMRLVPVLILVIAAGVPDVAAQRRERPPSAFETFALNESAFVSWAAPIGRLETAESRAIVTAVVYEERHTLQRMRGLRIDLVHLQPPETCNLTHGADLCAMPNAAIYLDEESLPAVRTAITRNYDNGVARGNYDNLIGSWWSRRPPGIEITGVTIGGHRFTGRNLNEVDALIERGIAALKAAPRE